ncbi:uncharacterized protein LOC125526958 isoform X1 [Triticum urartu]|uniref:uncharacterized protein LOC125526958 isoform X1 n=1 Tax=Triticum urartu TaxID=4572 RepID=UPI00204458B4|nr:uncharacterized protein LOC125526958 isoform X1 [Triticum urartu]
MRLSLAKVENASQICMRTSNRDFRLQGAISGRRPLNSQDRPWLQVRGRPGYHRPDVQGGRPKSSKLTGDVPSFKHVDGQAKYSGDVPNMLLHESLLWEVSMRCACWLCKKIDVSNNCILLLW